MRDVIRDFAHGKQRDAEVRDERVGRLSGRAVGAVCPVRQVQAREDPVVARVLVDVADGHRGAAEAVDEDGLVLALGEVDDAHEEREALERGGGGAVGVVEERAGEVHQRVD